MKQRESYDDQVSYEEKKRNRSERGEILAAAAEQCNEWNLFVTAVSSVVEAVLIAAWSTIHLRKKRIEKSSRWLSSLVPKNVVALSLLRLETCYVGQ